MGGKADQVNRYHQHQEVHLSNTTFCIKNLVFLSAKQSDQHLINVATIYFQMHAINGSEYITS